MLDRALLQRLCEVLAELCPQEDTSRMYATFAGLDVALISFGGTSKSRWFSILQVADNAGKVGDLLLVVQKDYGRNAGFQSVYQAYLQAIEQVNNTPSSNPEPIAHRPGRTTTKLVLDRNLPEYSGNDQEELIEAISRLLKVGKLELEVISVDPGSVVLTLELPSNKVLDLWRIIRDGLLEKYGVQEMTLDGANLSGANLSGADLKGANLTGANLIGANLTRAKLTGTNLSHANLSGAKLVGADLRRANLTGANLTGANTRLVFQDTHTLWPEGFAPSVYSISPSSRSGYLGVKRKRGVVKKGTMTKKGVAQRSTIMPLTPSEVAVLSLLAQQHTYEQIARALNLPNDRVKVRVNNIYRKLKATNRKQAIAKAQAIGILKQSGL